MSNYIAKFPKKIYNMSKIKSILCDEETFFLRPKKEPKKELKTWNGPKNRVKQ